MDRLDLAMTQNADEQIREVLGRRLPELPLPLSIAPKIVRRVVLGPRLAQSIAPMMAQRAVLRLRLAPRIVPGVI